MNDSWLVVLIILTATGVITTTTRTGPLTTTVAQGTRSTLLPTETLINPTVPRSDSRWFAHLNSIKITFWRGLSGSWANSEFLVSTFLCSCYSVSNGECMSITWYIDGPAWIITACWGFVPSWSTLGHVELRCYCSADEVVSSLIYVPHW